MNQEDIYLEKTLSLADDSYEKAYEYLLGHREEMETGDHASAWYFLMCLAAGSGKTAEALKWIQYAIEEKGYWYRPEVLEDEDLSTLFDHPDFIQYQDISNQRFAKAQKSAKTECTWQSKTSKEIMICLHGNGLNGEIAKNSWSEMKRQTSSEIQVEAIQSATVDSFGRYRWNYDDIDYKQIVDTLAGIQWEKYERKYLSGFSAGCDMILRAIVCSDIKCDEIFLQSPWIPFIKENIEKVVEAIACKNISVHIYCGTLDSDCKDSAQQLTDALQKKNVKVELIWEEGLRHQFPEDFAEYHFFHN